MNQSSKRAASGERKQDPKCKARGKHKARYPRILYVSVLVGFAIAAGLLFYEKLMVDHAEPESVSRSQSDPASSSDRSRYNRLLGRWQRPDGGYVIEIGGVNPDGSMRVAYYNPNPIQVSKALVQGKDAPIRIFIELNDVGYPGATYSLTYDRQNDVLKGVYYQPAVEQLFEVFFMRTN